MDFPEFVASVLVVRVDQFLLPSGDLEQQDPLKNEVQRTEFEGFVETILTFVEEHDDMVLVIDAISGQIDGINRQDSRHLEEKLTLSGSRQRNRINL